MKTLADRMRDNKQVNPGLSVDKAKTDAIRDVVRAVAGQVAQPTSGPRRTSLTENVAAGVVREEAGIQATEQRLALQAQAEEMKAAQFADTQSTKEAIERSKAQDETYMMQAQKLIDNAIANRERMSMKEMESMSNAARMLARQGLSNYRSELRREAKRAGIVDAASWKRQMARNIADRDTQWFRDQMIFESSLFMDSLRHQELVAMMNLDSAIELANQGMQQAAFQQMATGTSAAISATIQGAEKFGREDPNDPNSGRRDVV